MREERLAGLTVRMTGGIDGQGRGDGPAVILLHGFGAPGDDLIQLGDVIPAPPGTRFFFPAAPLAMPIEFGESLAWWMLDLERRHRESAVGLYRDLSCELPVGLSEARERLMAVLDELARRYEVDAARMVLGGFSQGAMLACDVALRVTRPPAGLVLLSGALIARDEWEPLVAKRRGLQVFISHGRHDPILPALGAEQLRDLLCRSGVGVEWVSFEGSHEIPEPVLIRLAGFLQRTLEH